MVTTNELFIVYSKRDHAKYIIKIDQSNSADKISEYPCGTQALFEKVCKWSQNWSKHSIS